MDDFFITLLLNYLLKVKKKQKNIFKVNNFNKKLLKIC